MSEDDLDFESIAVGAGTEAPATDDVVTPIHLSATFGLETPGFPETGYSYGRHGNPTRDALQERLAALAGTDHARAAASGMAAITSLCLGALSPGDHLVASDSLYGGTTRMFDRFLAPWGVEVTYVDATDPGAVADALSTETAVLWTESPTNPLLKVSDIAALSAAADDAGATFVVDNTFATPAVQRPVELGTDAAVLSTTKFVNGHSDAIGGAVLTDDEALTDRLDFLLGDILGARMAPFDAYLVLRGLKTLQARMDRHGRTATAVAEFLADHDAVAAVNYPGLPDHPGHDVAARQMDTFGGVLSFELDADGAETRAFVESLEVCNLAMSLGGVETLVEHTASMSGAALSAEERAEAGISDSLVRLSVGLESAEDLTADLDRGLARL